MEIRFASVADIRPLMTFMHEHWRAHHILSRNETLFRFDFQEGERLNLAIAEQSGDIVGLFGFMKYNSLDEPDLAGSLWKVVDDRAPPMLGLQLRRFVMHHVPHRFFAAPGAGLQTRSIYHLLGMRWIEMDHFYLANPGIGTRRICRMSTPAALPLHVSPTRADEFREVPNGDDLRDFPFLRLRRTGPTKDWAYLRRRFFTHPVYRYRVFRLSCAGEPVNIVVCREVAHAGARALRVVDFYGDQRHMPELVPELYELMHREGFEYVDFVCAGFDPRDMLRAGWRRLDFDRDDVVVPNYFEPFVMSNVRVYAVADAHPEITARLCRADGDQDRPNVDSVAAMSVAS
ncbi:MAG: hypothetical protein H6959_04335 [Chromatiaceae bacterium]|nr:hypothetical protein [Gammaproteobacteria bacterium]MCP5300048.1 hypothetical protein [Chromatiaceae bacterium]MCP5422120.1 hypothetical protein [Chromatiaceae bacterium]